MKTPLLVITTCASLAALGLAIFALSRPLPTTTDQTELKEQIAGLSGKITALQNELAKVQATQTKAAANLAEAKSAGDAATAEPGSKKPKAKEKNPLGALFKGLGEMMKSKEAQAGFKEMTQQTIQTQFKDILDLLNLNDQQKAALTEILAKAESDQQVAGLSFLGGKSKEEMKQLATEMMAKRTATQAEVQALLGPEKYKDYQRYEDSKPDREQLAMLRGTLKSTEHPLSEEQEQQVLDTLYRERKAYPWKLDYSNDREWDPAKLDPTNMENFLTEQEAYDKQMEGKLNGVLAPEQLDGFQKANNQRRTMTKFGIGMMKGMMGE